MTRLSWGSLPDRTYFSGVSHGVFYPKNQPAEVWDGLISVEEISDGVEQKFIYMDGEKRSTGFSLGSFAASIEVFTYPESLDDNEKPFGFSYRTELSGNEGYQLHIVYAATAQFLDKDYDSLGSNVSATTFSWNISTVPQIVPDGKPGSHFIVDSTKVYPGVLAELEILLYGDELKGAGLPTIQELIDFFEVRALFRIIDHGDGTFTATGPDDAVYLTSPTEFVLDWPSVVMISDDTYQSSSL